MDRRLALGALLGLPVLFAGLWLLSVLVPPLVAAGLGLLAYWAALGLAVGRRLDGDAVCTLTVAEPPGRLVGAMLALPVILLGAVTLRLLTTLPLPPHVLLAAALAAIAHAVIEEVFWRGALLPDPTPRAAAGALLLFWAFHLAWIGLRGLEVGLPLPVLLLGPLALGGVWTAARLASGTLGAGILAHAGLNLFLFAGIAARNLPAP